MFDHFISRLFRFYHSLLGKIALAFIGVAISYGFMVLQPVPVLASETVQVTCGIDGGPQIVRAAQEGCAYECNANGGGPDESPEPIWTDLKRQSTQPGEVELRCRNWDGSSDNTVFLNGGTEAFCLVGAG